jgi:hypothetical protein
VKKWTHAFHAGASGPPEYAGSQCRLIDEGAVFFWRTESRFPCDEMPSTDRSMTSARSTPPELEAGYATSLVAELATSAKRLQFCTLYTNLANPVSTPRMKIGYKPVAVRELRSGCRAAPLSPSGFRLSPEWLLFYPFVTITMEVGIQTPLSWE